MVGVSTVSGTGEIMGEAVVAAEMTALGQAADTTDRMIRESMGREGGKAEETKGGAAGITNEPMMTTWAQAMVSRTKITLVVVVVATEIEVSVGVT